MDGLECLDLLRASKGMKQTPVILMSAAPPQSVQACTDLVLLEKPFEMDTLLTLIRHFLEERLVAHCSDSLECSVFAGPKLDEEACSAGTS